MIADELFLCVMTTLTSTSLALPLHYYSYSLDIPESECVKLFQESQNFGIVKVKEAIRIEPTKAPTSAPTCSSDFYSIKGGSWDTACWHEEIKACSLDAARTLMDGHNWKAAASLNWSAGWSTPSGGSWTGEVKKEKCTDSGHFNDVQTSERHCFWQESLNNGCLYD